MVNPVWMPRDQSRGDDVQLEADFDGDGLPGECLPVSFWELDQVSHRMFHHRVRSGCSRGSFVHSLHYHQCSLIVTNLVWSNRGHTLFTKAENVWDGLGNSFLIAQCPEVVTPRCQKGIIPAIPSRHSTVRVTQ